MALPVDAGRATTNSTVSGTSHSLNLPGSIGSGDILVAIVRCPASTTIGWPAGWTEQEQSVADASDDETSIAWRLADGTEGATITITLGTSRVLVGIAWRVTGGVGIVFSAAATGSATQPDSPNLAPITTAADILWLTIGGCDDTETLTTTPTNYANGTVQGSTATGTAGCTVFGASRGLNAASENPGAWALGTTSIWVAWTVAILADAAFPSRVTQAPVEAGLQPTVAMGRATQVPVEVGIQPTVAMGRVTQVPVEAIMDLGNSKLRATQVVVEVIYLETPITAPPFKAYVID